jgi:hypothetical protein
MSGLYSVISTAVAEKSLIRLVVELKPTSADGLVYPPTYDWQIHHVISQRKLGLR